jgi:glycosyltransferase involved in cell wall biosynthesis
VRIAYVITRADAVGGASIHVRDMARGVIARGDEAAVFVGGSGPVTELLQAAGVPVRPLAYLRRAVHPWQDYVAYRELRGALREYAPDLVSAHTAKAGWLGRAAARALGLPAIYTPHGWSISDRISRVRGAVYTVAERVAAPWADAIVCVSQAERQLALEKRVGTPEQLRVIYNGVRDTTLRAEPWKHPPRLISIARFEAPKDHAALLEALAELRNLPWELTLVGDGPLETATRRRADELGLTQRITFCGYLPDPAHELALAQMFVLSSRSEGFPRSVLEAMRAGLAVVACDVGGVREAVEDGVTGFLGLHALRKLILDPDARTVMGANGRAAYERRFRFELTLDRTYAVYRETLARRGSL